MIDTLPSWNDCFQAVSDGKADPVEQFIYDNEPDGEDAKKFRIGLLNALYFFCGKDAK